MVHTMPEDIFNHLVDCVISDLLNDNYEPPDEELVSLACTLRLVSRHANIVVRPFVSPVLELESRRHAALVFRDSVPNRAAIRSLTFAGAETTIYYNQIYHTLYPYDKLQRLVFDDHGTPGTTRLEPIRLGPTMESLSELAIITSLGVREQVFRRFIDELSSNRDPISRLAVHGFSLTPSNWGPWKFLKLEALVVRVDITPYDLRRLDDFICCLPSLKFLTIVSSSTSSLLDSLAAFHKRIYAESRQISIIEVLPPVLEADIPAWFAEQVRRGLIFQLTGKSWADGV